MNYVELMIPIVQEAGDLVLSYFGKPITVQVKADGSICTNVDTLSQQLLIQKLGALISGSGFIAEELGVHQVQEFTWVIDPLDGTRNFVQGLPYFAVNVALMHHNSVIAAVTYMPALSDMVYAQLGSGCWRNGQRISPLKELGDQNGAIVSLPSMSLTSDQAYQDTRRILSTLGRKVSVRISGAVAVDLVYVACGVLDLAIVHQAHWWDVAAGTLLIHEAGGVVYQSAYSINDPVRVTMVAGKKQLCELSLQR